MTAQNPTERLPPSFLFDLDGTLVDSVYHHVLAWNEALQATGLPLSVWRIHRRIGMSGGLFANALQRDLGREIDPAVIVELRKRHAVAFNARSHTIQPLPGAVELLKALTGYGVKWAIATSGRLETARPNIERLGVDFNKVPVVTRDQVRYAKPDPDLFLTAAERLGVDIENCMVVGDSIWDLMAARRARALGIGVLSGGYGEDELDRAGAYRVYEDPADLLNHLDEVGVRRPT
jgi:HAD superfamily hydrolase (TIGR01549 family)